jgi:hypothetical protein
MVLADQLFSRMDHIMPSSLLDPVIVLRTTPASKPLQYLRSLLKSIDLSPSLRVYGVVCLGI